MIQLILFLIVIGVLLYLVGLIPMDNAIKTIIRVVVLIAVILWLLDGFGVLHGMNSWPRFHA